MNDNTGWIKFTNKIVDRYADMMAKAKREEEDTKRQMAANKDTLEVLQRQVAALEAQKQIEKALIEEEAEILVRNIFWFRRCLEKP